jgi:hypothetical protein
MHHCGWIVNQLATPTAQEAVTLIHNHAPQGQFPFAAILAFVKHLVPTFAPPPLRGSYLATYLLTLLYDFSPQGFQFGGGGGNA